jgi:glutathione S-transferase
LWITHDIEMTGERRLSLETKLGYSALGVMDGHLEDRDFFVADRYSITDIALYAYTHVAGERGFELDLFPAVRAWLERVREQQGHVPITKVDRRRREPGDAHRMRALRRRPRRLWTRLYL